MFRSLKKVDAEETESSKRHFLITTLLFLPSSSSVHISAFENISIVEEKYLDQKDCPHKLPLFVTSPSLQGLYMVFIDKFSQSLNKDDFQGRIPNRYPHTKGMQAHKFIEAVFHETLNSSKKNLCKLPRTEKHQQCK